MGDTITKAKMCAHCFSRPAMDREPICEECDVLPRCEVCEVFFDGLVEPSSECPTRCTACLNFELLIKFSCFLCGKPIPVYLNRNSGVLHYIVRGNACGDCNGDAWRNSKISKKEEKTSQFVGYLSLVELRYQQGEIDRGQFEYAIRMNPHDVVNWDGYERIKEDIIREEVEDEPVDLLDAYD